MQYPPTQCNNWALFDTLVYAEQQEEVPMLFSLEFKDDPSRAGSLISKESKCGPNKLKLVSQARRARKNCLKCPLFLPQRIRGSVKVPRLRYNPMKRNPRVGVHRKKHSCISKS